NLGLIPFGHSYGIGNLIMPLLLQGTCIAFASGFVPSQMAGWIRKHRITVYPSVPALLRILADTPSLKTLKPLRLVISAGAVLDPEIARRFHRKFDLKIHNFYGSSETGGIAYDRS